MPLRKILTKLRHSAGVRNSTFVVFLQIFFCGVISQNKLFAGRALLCVASRVIPTEARLPASPPRLPGCVKAQTDWL
jgi:hypothetical protein